MQFFKQSFGDADTAVHSVKEHDQSHMHHTALHPIQLIVSQFDSLDLHAADEDSGGGGGGGCRGGSFHPKLSSFHPKRNSSCNVNYYREGPT